MKYFPSKWNIIYYSTTDKRSRRRSLPWTDISNVLNRLLYTGFDKIGIIVFICIAGFKTICITKPTSMLNSSCSTVATE